MSIVISGIYIPAGCHLLAEGEIPKVELVFMRRADVGEETSDRDAPESVTIRTTDILTAQQIYRASDKYQLWLTQEEPRMAIVRALGQSRRGIGGRVTWTECAECKKLLPSVERCPICGVPNVGYEQLTFPGAERQ